MTVESPDAAVPFARAFADAIAERGVTLSWLRSRLKDLGTPVSMATLSYWRSGRRQPEHRNSIDALHSLEELLRLPSGHLVARLGPSRRAQPGRASKSVLEDLGGTEWTRVALEGMGYEPDLPLKLTEISTHAVVEIDARGQQRTVTSRSMWEAESDGVRGAPEIFELVHPGGPEFEFNALAGCSIGATYQDCDNGVFGYELLFERPLRKGESAITEYVVNIPPEANQSALFELSLSEELAQAVLWLRFDPDRVPARCEAYSESADGHRVVQELPRARSVHTSAHGAQARTLGIRWEW